MTIPLARIAFRSRVARLLLVTVGTAALAGSAQVNVPMVPVPMTLQSYALVTLAALAGWRLAVEITQAYLVVGLLGLPVFSRAKGGISVLLGPTGGYLAGFLIAALVVGYLAERSRHTTLSLIGLMAFGHAILLTIGVGWLATKIGIPLAVEKGLVPFLPGAGVKILLAAATLLLVERIPAKGAGD